MGKELDQEEIDLVAVRVNPDRPIEMVLQQGLQGFFAGQTCGLKELAQLMDFYFLVHFQEPSAGLLHRFLRWILHAGLQVGTRRGQLDHNSRPRALYRGWSKRASRHSAAKSCVFGFRVMVSRSSWKLPG